MFSDWNIYSVIDKDKDQSVQDGILQAGGLNSEDMHKIFRRYILCLKDIACIESLVNLISLLYKEI